MPAARLAREQSATLHASGDLRTRKVIARSWLNVASTCCVEIGIGVQFVDDAFCSPLASEKCPMSVVIVTAAGCRAYGRRRETREPCETRLLLYTMYVFSGLHAQ